MHDLKVRVKFPARTPRVLQDLRTFLLARFPAEFVVLDTDRMEFVAEATGRAWAGAAPQKDPATEYEVKQAIREFIWSSHECMSLIKVIDPILMVDDMELVHSREDYTHSLREVHWTCMPHLFTGDYQAALKKLKDDPANLSIWMDNDKIVAAWVEAC